MGENTHSQSIADKVQWFCVCWQALWYSVRSNRVESSGSTAARHASPTDPEAGPGIPGIIRGKSAQDARVEPSTPAGKVDLERIRSIEMSPRRALRLCSDDDAAFGDLLYGRGPQRSRVRTRSGNRPASLLRSISHSGCG